jgi:hypothetical protein
MPVMLPGERWERSVGYAIKTGERGEVIRTPSNGPWRKVQDAPPAPPAAPAQLPKPDFGPLLKMMAENMESIAKDGHALKDFDHYVFEVALNAVYGPKIWDWYNKHNRGE